ncbi:MAG: hypothetical protein ACR2N6_09470 [Miltoncostaeaceae bacterium]
MIGVLVAFLIYNLQQAIDGRWELGDSPSIDTEDLRKFIGLFAMVQGFEAARYIGVRFSGEQRISSMRLAQGVSTIVFVILVASLLLLFLPPATKTDGTAIFFAANEIGDALPWLLLLAAIGSQTSATLGATGSRSDMLVNAKVPRRLTFLVILIPAIVLIFVTDIAVAVNIASRVFAAYFLIQALLAGILARRRGSWGAVAGFTAIGLVMAVIMVFGLPL